MDANDAAPHQRRAQDDATLSTAAFVAGGAFIAGGALLYFMGGQRQEHKTGDVAVAPDIEPGAVGVVLKGAF